MKCGTHIQDEHRMNCDPFEHISILKIEFVQYFDRLPHDIPISPCCTLSAQLASNPDQGETKKVPDSRYYQQLL